MPSIFDEINKPNRPRKPRSEESQSTAGVPFGQSKSKEEVDKLIENPAAMKLQDVDNVITRMREIHDDIEKKLDVIYQKSGLTPKYIKDYLNNPNNFNPQEWEKIQQDRQALFSSLTGGTRVEEMENKTKTTEKELDKEAKDRRGKMIGSRKNWIPIR
jgi:hypothetical protein